MLQDDLQFLYSFVGHLLLLEINVRVCDSYKINSGALVLWNAC